MTSFTATVYQNEYLAAGADLVDAIVRIDASGSEHLEAPTTSSAAEVVIVDCSGSMNQPKTRISEARVATAAAVECIRDGVEFAIVAGRNRAEPVYPADGTLAIASPATREAACREVATLRAGGGTAMGRWLLHARELFAGSAAELRHAILLTDGKNEGESPQELAAAVDACKGEFQCDCRGVGADWQVAELRTVASGLLGTVDLVREPEGLRAEFTEMIERAMGRNVAAAQLHVWTPVGAEVVFVKQVAPTIEDLTPHRTPVSDLVGSYPTGAWGEESRDYHVRVRVPVQSVGERMLAARVSLVTGDEVTADGRVLCVWTDDDARSTRIDPEVAHATGQSQLADALAGGADALARGDHGAATVHFGRAVKLAASAGDTARLDQLRRVVEIDDPHTGTVRLRRDAARIDAIELEATATKTVRRPVRDGAAP